MSVAPTPLRCLVAYATRERQYLWSVQLPAGASIAQALAAARAQAAARGEEQAVLWDSAAVGVFGELRARSARCADGERIELYRPLGHDPRAARRARVQRERRAHKGR